MCTRRAQTGGFRYIEFDSSSQVCGEWKWLAPSASPPGIALCFHQMPRIQTATIPTLVMRSVRIWVMEVLQTIYNQGSSNGGRPDPDLVLYFLPLSFVLLSPTY